MKLTIDSRKVQCPVENNYKANRATRQKKEFSLKVKMSILGGTNTMKKKTANTHTHTHTHTHKEKTEYKRAFDNQEVEDDTIHK